MIKQFQASIYNPNNGHLLIITCDGEMGNNIRFGNRNGIAGVSGESGVAELIRILARNVFEPAVHTKIEDALSEAGYAKP
jgi:hypothetical protein